MTNCQNAKKVSIIKLRGEMKNEKFREQRFSIWIIDESEGDIRIKLTEHYLEVLCFFLKCDYVV